MMAGKRAYLTASTAREHINKVWEKEGRMQKQSHNMVSSRAKLHYIKQNVKLDPLHFAVLQCVVCGVLFCQKMEPNLNMKL